MKTTRVILLPALLALVLLSGCGALRPGIPGSGISHSESRQLASFQEVNLSGFGTVNVFVGETPSVHVTTDDNLLAHVETRVENGQLWIQPRGSIKPKTGLNVDVTVPRLTAARISGAGDMNIENVISDELALSISGAGSLTATGCVKNISASISGAGDADLQKLYAENATIRISGAGDASIHASQSIKARISGVGDVVCFGNPAHVDEDVSGLGDLEFRTTEVPIRHISDLTPR